MGVDDGLVVHGIDVSFGGMQALRDVSFVVPPGSVTALIGPNGAGKTTTVNVISGLQRASQGTVTLDGADISRVPPHDRVGIARTFQIGQAFAGMSVLESVLVGLHRQVAHGFVRSAIRDPGVRESERVARARAAELLQELNLSPLAGRLATSLSLGQERILEVARALASSPRVMLMDEVASGLTAGDQELMVSIIKKMKQASLAVLLVEHNMRFVRSVCDRAVVLNFGEVIFEGDIDLAMKDQRVASAYLGTDQEGAP